MSAIFFQKDRGKSTCSSVHLEPGRPKAFGSAVPGIGDFAPFLTWNDIQQHFGPRFAITRIKAADIGHVRTVHADDEIELVKIIGVQLATTIAGNVYALLACLVHAAGVRWFTYVIVGRTGAIHLDFETALAGSLAESGFGKRGTADIAETDEQYLDQGIPPKNVPYWPSGHSLDYHEPLAVRQDEK